MSQSLGEESLEQRLTEIRAAIERMDFRWDQGFITDKNDYLEKRVKLQQDLEQLTPISNDDLERAVDMLQNFETHWNATNGDRVAQRDLIQLIVARVWVRDDCVVAMSLRPNYHITVGLENELIQAFRKGRDSANWLKTLPKANNHEHYPNQCNRRTI